MLDTKSVSNGTPSPELNPPPANGHASNGSGALIGHTSTENHNKTGNTMHNPENERLQVVATHQMAWSFSDSHHPSGVIEPEQETSRHKIHTKLAEALTLFNDILGPFPYVSFTFPGQGDSGYSQVHLSRPKGDPNSIAVDVVPDIEKGARYSDISSRVFGKIEKGGVTSTEESVGEHYTAALAEKVLSAARLCEVEVKRFQRNDIVLHNNPQGVQEYVNQPLGGFKDTGGQNKYVECFARTLGATVPNNKENAACQIIVNRSGPSQTEILEKSGVPVNGASPSVRKGLHFFPAENVCLAFVEDKKPTEFMLKEESHPRWTKLSGGIPPASGVDHVRVSGGRLRSFGIEDGIYVMSDPGPMKELADSSKNLLSYFKLPHSTQGPEQYGRVAVFANHYVDGAYYGEFMSRHLEGSKVKNFFFIHSLGTFKAEGLGYPEKLMGDVASAAKLEQQLRFHDRILGELWIVQRNQSLIANSASIARHAHQLLGARHEPPTMIAVDDTAQGHISRSERREKALPELEKLYQYYLTSCDNTQLGEPVPAEKRLSFEQLVDAQIIFERSRHAEADSKGKWAVVKAMAIAQSDPLAQAEDAPHRVLVVNVNLAAIDGSDDKFKKEIQTIIADINSIRANGGHVIVRPSFDYDFGLKVCKFVDCYVALPAFEPFGMGVLEAAAAGAPIISISNLPSVNEVLVGTINEQHTKDLSFINLPLRNSVVEVAVAQGAVLVGGHPDEREKNPARYTTTAFNGAAAVINAITLGHGPTTSPLIFSPELLGRGAAELFAASPYNWKNVGRQFYEEIYGRN